MGNPQQRKVLHGLGFYLSINEWIDDATKKQIQEKPDEKQQNKVNLENISEGL